MKLVTLDQRTDKWHEWRNSGVTATDSTVLLGSFLEKTPLQLWEEKTGRRTPADLSMIPAVRYGCEHEDDARILYEKLHHTLVTPCCAEFDEDSDFRASFDGIDMFTGEPVEFKCPLPGGKTLFDVKANGRLSEAYRRYVVQVQQQLLVSEKEVGHLVFYEDRPESEGGAHLIEFDINRDEVTIARIRSLGKAFCEHLRDDTPPQRCERDVWIPAGEKAQRWAELANHYFSVKDQITDLESRKKGIEQELLSMMGSERLAEYAGLSVSVSTSNKVDFKSALFELLGRRLSVEEEKRFTKSVTTRHFHRKVNRAIDLREGDLLPSFSIL